MGKESGLSNYSISFKKLSLETKAFFILPLNLYSLLKMPSILLIVREFKVPRGINLSGLDIFFVFFSLLFAVIKFLNLFLSFSKT